MFPQGWDCHGLPTSARIEKTRGIARHQNPDVRVSEPAQVTRSVLCRVWAKPANPTTVVTATAIGAVTLRGVCSKLWFSGYLKPEAVSTRLESTTPPKPRQHHVA